MNTGALAGSNLWRIAVSFVLQLLIARQLGPEGLGIYTVALSYLHVCQVLSEMGLPALLIRDLAPTPNQRLAYFSFALRVQGLAALAVWAGLFALTWILPFAGSTRVALWLIGASLPFYAVTSASETLFQAVERMEMLMGVEVLINLLILGTSILALSLNATVLHLVAILIVTQAVSASICLVLLRRSRILTAPQEKVHIRLNTIWQRSSPFFGLAVADVLLQRMDILLLSIFGGELITGIYSFAYNLVRVLVKLVQSFWQAIYPTLSRLYHQSSHKYPILARLSLRHGLLLLLPAAILSASIADHLLFFIYGQADATPVYQRLVWLAPILFIETYAATMLMVQHRARQSLTISGAHLGTLVILLPILTAVQGATGAAWAAILAGLAGTGISFVLLRRARIPLRINHALVVAAIATLATTQIMAQTVVLPLGWLLRLLVGAVVYIAVVWQMGVIDGEDFRLFQRALRIDGERDIASL